MPIKLKAFRFEYTQANWYKAVDKAKSESSYSSTPVLIPEVYYQDTNGIIGGIRIGTEHTVWIPAKYAEKFTRGEKLQIGNNTFSIQDIQENFYRKLDGSIWKPNSPIESHYEITILHPND
jgi:hypothetical protein